MPEPASAEHPALAAARLRGHLENIEREIGHAAWVLAGHQGLLPDQGIRRLILLNAVASELLAELPAAPLSI